MRFPLLALMLVISGCMTHDRVKAPPVVQAPMQVFVAKAPPSGLDGLPIGAYQIDDTSFVVSGHQSGASLGAVLLFGAPGIAAANAAEGARSRRELGDSPARLTSDLTVPAFALLADDIGRRGLGERFRLTVSPSWGDDAQVLTVIPYVLLAYEENDQVRPYIFLKASLAAGDERRWSTRYISAERELRPMSGAGGWAEDGAKALKASIDRQLALTVDLLLRDLNGELPRSTARNVKLKTRFAFSRNDLDLPGRLIEETGRTVVFLPRAHDSWVFSGLNAFDKDMVTISDPKAAGAAATDGT